VPRPKTGRLSYRIRIISRLVAINEGKGSNYLKGTRIKDSRIQGGLNFTEKGERGTLKKGIAGTKRMLKAFTKFLKRKTLNP
jgi:hypothetical protein